MAQIKLHGKKALIIHAFHDMPDMIIDEYSSNFKNKPKIWKVDRWKKQVLHKKGNKRR